MMRLTLLAALGMLLPGLGAAQTYVLVVSGLGGEPTYVERFHSWGANLVTAVVDELRVPADHVVYLAEDPERDARIGARSTRENVRAALAALAGRVEPDARLFIVLIGHGSATGGTPKLNLPGPDITAADVAADLRRFASQDVVVVNLTTASGDWVTALSADRRIVITATRSATERYESRFGEYFIAGLTSAEADTDKNDRVSLLEAFEYARHEVARAYDHDNRLLTEHALIDDNGDGKGVHEPDLPSGDGARAHGWFLAATAIAPVPDNPALAALYEERQRLELELAALRGQKAALDSLIYEHELETLLLSLARTNRSIRETEGRERS